MYRSGGRMQQSFSYVNCRQFYVSLLLSFNLMVMIKPGKNTFIYIEKSHCITPLILMCFDSSKVLNGIYVVLYFLDINLSQCVLFQYLSSVI